MANLPERPLRILITRTDRLGDVLIATPVLKRVYESFPKAEIYFLVQKMWTPVLQYGEKIKILEFNPAESVDELAERLKALQFDIAVVIRDEKVVTLAVKKAGIPRRIGPYSTWRSFFSFNHGVWQKRSRSKMHEAEYNLQLLTKMGIPFPGPASNADQLPRSWIETDPKQAVFIQEWLRHQGLHPKKYVCLHPGSSGSARYLSTETMTQIVRDLLLRGNSVVLTGTKAETSLLNEIAHGAAPDQGKGKLIIFGGDHPQDLGALAELYRQSSLVIAHGTGPLHLAAAVGTRVYAVFPPLHVLSETRWGPLVSARTVWVPNVDCPEKYKCRGVKCEYYDCMSTFKPQQIPMENHV
jgi:ADP-heptose:LPS heptosyltransferase